MLPINKLAPPPRQAYAFYFLPDGRMMDAPNTVEIINESRCRGCGSWLEGDQMYCPDRYEACEKMQQRRGNPLFIQAVTLHTTGSAIVRGEHTILDRTTRLQKCRSPLCSKWNKGTYCPGRKCNQQWARYVRTLLHKEALDNASIEEQVEGLREVWEAEAERFSDEGRSPLIFQQHRLPDDELIRSARKPLTLPR